MRDLYEILFLFRNGFAGKKYKEHLVKAKLERNYYNKNTKLAEQQKKLADEHFITRGKADYCSVDATAHYSYKMFTFHIMINK